MDSEFPKESCVFLQNVTPKWLTSACYRKSWNPSLICVDENLGVDDILMLTIRCADRKPGSLRSSLPSIRTSRVLDHFWCTFDQFLPSLGDQHVGTKQRSMSHKKNRYEINLMMPMNFGFNMGVSKYRGGPPKWMVKIMENPMNKWMIWGVFTHDFWKHPHCNLPPEIPQKKPSTPWLPWDRFAWWLAPGAVLNKKFHQQRDSVLGRVFLVSTINYQGLGNNTLFSKLSIEQRIKKLSIIILVGL